MNEIVHQLFHNRRLCSCGHWSVNHFFQFPHPCTVGGLGDCDCMGFVAAVDVRIPGDIGRGRS